MYFRIAARNQGGQVHWYLQFVEAYCQDGRSRQRVLYSFGNVETLREDGQLARLIASLERATDQARPGIESLQTGRVLEYGGLRLALALWDQFALTGLLTSLLGRRRFQFDPVAANAMMVFNRLLAPKVRQKRAGRL